MVKAALTTHARLIFSSILAASIHAAVFHGYSYQAPMSGNTEPHTPVNLTIRFTVEPDGFVEDIPVLEEQEQIEPEELLTKQLEPAKPVVKSVVKQDRPAKPKKKKQLPEKVIKKIAKRSIEQVIQTPKSISQPIIVVEDALAVQKSEDLFINELLHQIERNKFYPKKAKRRNIQGTVQVELKLDDTGNIVSLQLTEGHKFLRKAASTAIQATAPFNVPPSSLTVPRSIRFGVHYQFR